MGSEPSRARTNVPDTWTTTSHLNTKHSSGLTCSESYTGFDLDSEKKTLLSVFGQNRYIQIPESVETISSYAFRSRSYKTISFQGCSKLKSIPSDAFETNCSIQKLILPMNFANISGISRQFIQQVEFEVGNPNFEGIDDFVVSTDSRILWRYFGECKEITIPCYIEQLDASCFRGNCLIRRVVFEEGSEIREFVTQTFCESSITSIILPDSLEIIGDECFKGCKNLCEIEFPDSVTKIGNKAFSESGIKHVSFGYTESEIREFGAEAFADCLLVDIVLPEALRIVGSFCFKGCKKLREIVIIGSLNNVGDCICSWSGLEQVSFVSQDIEVLWGTAFASSNLTCIIIPQSVMKIEKGCFSQCTKLSEVIFEKESKLMEIEMSCFANTAIQRITIPHTVRIIGDFCFCWCEKLRYVCFESESQLTILGRECFRGTAIESICLPKSIEQIGASCFMSCSKLSWLKFELGAVINELDDILGGSTHSVSVLIPKTINSLSKDFLGNIYHIEFEAGSPFYVECNRVFHENGIFIGDLGSPINGKLVIPPKLQLADAMFKNDQTIKSVKFHPEWTGTGLKRDMFSSSILQKIVIPKCITVIEDRCFMTCESLRIVQFMPGSQLKKLCTSVFSLSGLEDIVIPSSVEEIERSAFEKCNNLKHVKFEAESRLKKISEEAFKGSGLRRIVLPSSVIELGANLCEYCINLKQVEFKLGSNINNIPKRTFNGSHLSNITIPRSVEQIDNSAFKNTEYLKKVKFESGSQLKRICQKAFKCSGLRKIVLPRTLQEIGQYAFALCYSLDRVQFESKSELKRICGNAFEASRALRSITIPGSVEIIERCAFQDSNLTKVAFESASQLKVIDESAFAGTSMTSVSIPDSVTVIGNECFAHTPLTECVIGENSRLETLGKNVFRGLFHLFVPSKVVHMTSASLSGVWDVTFSPNNPYFSILERLWLSRDQTMIYGITVPRNSVRIPRNVKVVKKNCFYGIKSLISIEFEEESQLEIVEEDAFSKTSLTRIRFPRNLRQLENCFKECEKLSEITFDDECPLEEIPNFSGIGNDVIALHVPTNVRIVGKCTLLCCAHVKISPRNMYIRASNQFVYHTSGDLLGQIGHAKEVVIPKYVTRIPEKSFKRRNIVSVMFEEGSELTEIGDEAFSDCESLMVVSFQNTSHLRRIGDQAFWKCSNMSIEIPRTVEYIGVDALAFVRNVSVQEGSLYFSTSNEMILNNKGTTLLGFCGDKSQEKFILQRHIETIGKSCFSGYQSKIFAFEDYSVLETIEDRSFCNSEFTEVEIPSSVTKIGEKCFHRCKVEKIHFQTGLKLSVFGKGVFKCSYLQSIVIPASVADLGIACFEEAKGLTSVSFEEHSNLICIRSRCFFGCGRLESFNFELCTSLRYIHDEAFSGTKISKAILYPKIEFISATAFEFQCNIILVNNFEDTSLQEWVRNRDANFVRERSNDFYLQRDFIQTKTIGSGSFGVVYLVENQFTSEQFAVKEVKECFANRDQFENEIELLKLVRHPCVIPLKGYSLSSPMSMCMEFAPGGTLEDALSSLPDWFDSTCRLMSIVGIACGMSHIHSRNVIHRDLKPSNVLFDSYHRVMISDFGTARFDSLMVTMNIGTPLYMAPEITGECPDITQRVDVFSFGLILYQIIEGVSVSSLKEQIQFGIGHLSFSSSSKEAHNLIEACLDSDPSLRPEFSEIVEELERLNFYIIDGVDREMVSEYFKSISTIS